MSDLERQIVKTETIELGMSIVGLRNGDGTVMNAIGGTGKFSVAVGGWGSGTVKIVGQAASGNTKTGTAMGSVVVPANFQKSAYALGAKLLKVKVNHKTDPVANTTSNIDVEVYKSDGNGGIVGADLVTTTVITNNSTTWSEQEFDVTATGIEPGDELVVLVRAVVDDSAGAASAIAHIGSVTLEYNAKM